MYLSPNNPALATLSRQDRKRFCDFSAGASRTPAHKTIISAIHDAMNHYPQSTAARTVRPDGSLHPTQQLSYASLRCRANLVSSALHARGVCHGESVCIFLSRGLDMLVAIVAVLQLGASYVPQDARVAPHAQLLRVASATRTRIVLTTNQHASKLPQFPNSVVLTVKDAEKEGTALPTFSQPVRTVCPSDTCYIIFTSGTTGEPKGVQVTHGNLANVLLTDPMSLQMKNGVRVSQILSIAFDMCAWETLGCLSHGATLVIRGRNISHAIQHAHIVISTPSVLGSIDSSRMHHVQTVAVAGEPCPRALADEWSKFCTFYNSCGPTEVTIINTAKRYTSGETHLTIGKPTPNNTVYILHKDTREPCRIGEVGEMWAGGACVSKGYIRNEVLTNKRFVEDPYIGGGARMYRTGDLGRWTNVGELEHFGRVDDQVKVKGFRVELDGVSSVVESLVTVKKAVVMKINDSLVAFVTPAHVTVDDVKNVVKTNLPYYCVPSEVLSMEELPRTLNGKVDKRVLFSNMIHRYAAAGTDGSNDLKNRITIDTKKHLLFSPIIQGALRSVLLITRLVRYFLAAVQNI